MKSLFLCQPLAKIPKSREEGVRTYLVFTNKQLVEFVAMLPDSLTALTNLHGVGPGKVER